MLNISVLNTILVILIVVTAILIAIVNKKRISTVLLSTIGILMSLEFLVLKAPRIAIIEFVVGVVLIPTLFVMAQSKKG